MASPAPALLQLRRQVDERWPLRDRRSDGIMGDAAHRLRRSAHNLGNALDLTADARHGPNLDVLVADLVRQMRANPGGGRLRLIIWNRTLWSAPWNKGRRYFGVNPHTSHAHLEVKPELRGVARAWTVRG